jgi:SAM-dependent methyltransferase
MADEANPLNRIAQIIPDGARVLDVGAGNGVLARLFRYLGKNVTLDAVEPDPIARAVAEPHYRFVFGGDVNAFVEASAEGAERYDFIVLADVVEHIANPQPVLEKLKSLLSPGGRIVISTPNIAFAAVRIALLNGRFDYVDSGILERTHLRFYTLKSLRLLFSEVGLFPYAQYHCLRDPRGMEIEIDGLPMSGILLRLLARDRLAYVYQFLFVLGAAAKSNVETEELGLCKSGRKMRMRSLVRWIKSRTATGPRRF